MNERTKARLDALERDAGAQLREIDIVYIDDWNEGARRTTAPALDFSRVHTIEVYKPHDCVDTP